MPDDPQVPGHLPPWEDVQENFRRQFPQLDPAVMQRRYNQMRAQREAKHWEQGAEARVLRAQSAVPRFIMEHSVPFAGPVASAVAGSRHEAAQRRVQAGTADTTDFLHIADYERQQQEEAQRRSTLGGAVGEGLATAPALIGEAMIGAGVGRALGAGARAATWIGAAVPNLVRIPQEAIGNAAQTEQPTSWTDFQNLAPAAAMAGLRTAIFGTAGQLAQRAIPGAGVGPYLGRLGAGVGLGLAEIQAVDAIGGAAHLHTGYGYIGDMIQGRGGEAMQRLVVDTLTLAAFTTLHNRPAERPAAAPAEPAAPEAGPAAAPVPPPRGPAGGLPTPEPAAPGAQPAPNPVMQSFADLLSHLRRSGYSRDRAAYLVQREFAEPIFEGLQKNPNATASEIRGWMRQYPENSPLRRFADTLAESLGEANARRQQTPEQPQTAPEAPPAAAPPQPTTEPPAGEIAAPERSQAAIQAPTPERPTTGTAVATRPIGELGFTPERRMVPGEVGGVFGDVLSQQGIAMPEQAPAAAVPAEQPQGQREWFGRPVEPVAPESEHSDLHSLIDRANLSHNEREILLRVGVDRQTLEEAGAFLGMSREGARQALIRVEGKLHKLVGDTPQGQSLIKRLEAIDEAARRAESAQRPTGEPTEEQLGFEPREIGFTREEATSPEVRAATNRAKAPLSPQEQLQQKVQEAATKLLDLSRRMEREAKRGTLTEERRAFYAAERERIASDVRQLTQPPSEARGEVPGGGGPGERAEGVEPPAEAKNAPLIGAEPGTPVSGAQASQPTPAAPTPLTPSEAAAPAEGAGAVRTPAQSRGTARRGQINLEPFRQFGDDIKRVFAPASRGPEARTGAGVVRQSLAEMVRRQEIAKNALHEGAAYFDRWMPTDPQGRTAAFLQVFDAMESGQHANLPDPIRGFADVMRKLIDERTDLVRNRGLVTTFINDYVGHLWQQRGANLTPEEIARKLGARRPLSGREGFRRERFYDTYRDGIAAGLEPIDWNPARLVLRTLEQVDKAVMGRDVVDQLALQGLWQFKRLGDKIPEGWRRIEDKLATVFKPRQMGAAGPELVGHYYTPEPIAKLLDNYLQPGMRGNMLYDAIRGFGNLLNQFQLGFSAFHLGFVAVDTQVSAAALGLQRLSRGDVIGGGRQILKTPVEPFLAYLRGNKVLREYFSPGSQGAETAALVERLMEGGGRASMDSFYGGTHLDSFRRAIRELRAGKASAAGSAIWHALPALSEAVSYPIMQAVVPRMKLAVFADLARYELDEKMPNATADQRRQAMGRVWDSVENRLGQMTYDNVFWNRTFKDVMMASVRSVGWNLGTWREIGGGIADIPKSVVGVARGEGISHRLAYIAGLVGVTGLLGAIYQYLATGEGPKEPRDLFFPRTGGMAPDGNPERVALPSYMRDIQQLTNRADEGPLRLIQNAGEMARGKLNPGLVVAGEMLFNRDFHDQPIRNANDPIVSQAGDTAMHLLQSFESFSTRALHDPRHQDQTLGQRAQATIGITTASSRVTQSWEQQRVLESLRNEYQRLKQQRQDYDRRGQDFPEEWAFHMIGAAVRRVQDREHQLRGMYGRPLRRGEQPTQPDAAEMRRSQIEDARNVLEELRRERQVARKR